ncbi:acyl-CoA dehydrogenase family protein [Falsiroseomonas sp. E2-1-a20]|uniref:acyl-CoA dehydrogenase family protein n=1 Tax=Falsiroseomonas sp. E2-1-a20 TaxID=3239300 RepID=UPI003F2F14D8
MDILPPRLSEPAPLQALAALHPRLEAEAEQGDRDGRFPEAGVAALAGIGLLRAPLDGLGTAPEGAAALALTLRRIGRASLPLGRLFEGHVNALRLVLRHGDPGQRRQAGRDAEAGHLFAVWNTDDAAAPLMLRDGVLSGRKILCSGAGHVPRALVTARTAPDAPPQMLLLELAAGERADLSGWTPLGMKASVSGAMDFEGVVVPEAARIGAPGAYATQPDFSAGAWRFAAVQCGGMEAVLEQLRAQHRRTGRGGDPNQAARLGQAAIAVESARLWVEAAAGRAETGAADAAAYTNLARSAVERAALDLLELAQRSVGLQAFMTAHPLQRLCRDLATYLRQPGPDGALAAGAAHLLDAPGAAGEVWT